MNLKNLALLVGITQTLIIVLSLYQGRGYFSWFSILHVALNLPLAVFFFYVWKRQKP